MGSFRNLNFKIIFHLMGLLLTVNGAFILISALVSFIYSDGVALEMLLAGVVGASIGGLIMIFTKNHRKEINKREKVMLS